MLTFCITFILNSSLYGQSLPQSITVSVPRGDGGGLVTMILEKYSVRDPNYCKYFIDNQVYSVGQNASPQSANPLNFTEQNLSPNNFPVRTYRGYIVEEPNSVVVATIWPGNSSITAYIHEGQRYLWDIENLPINLNLSTGVGNISVTQAQAYNYSQINPKSSDWIPTFGNTPPPAAQSGSGPVPSGNSDNGWKLIPSTGFQKMQIAFDVQPEVCIGLSDAEVFARIEHGTNLLDLQFARDLGIQFRITGVVRRMDTDALENKGDAITIWRNLGLMDNPGSTNTTTNSIPAQQIVYSQSGEGNPVAYQSMKPLNGGNFVSVEVENDDNGGFLHEVSHTWGGAHFVYPRDIMSGGGSWFGPTTNQRHIYVRNNPNITGGLGVATNAEYGYNISPYATPDLINTYINQSTTIEVLKNDFDCNGDTVHISTFDSNSEHGGSVTMNQGNFIYTPPIDFIGRDQFTYIITDGTLFNETWVQVDVSNGGLELRYNFELAGDTTYDQSGANHSGVSENFTATLGIGVSSSTAWIFPDLGGITTQTDETRPFVDFGDVTDPFNGSHTVSIWFKIKPAVLNGTLNCHIVSNSSTAINKLISGYNIYIDKTTKKLTFEVMEMLNLSDPTIDGNLLTINGDQVQANAWIHAVMVIDRNNNTIKAFMDGNQVGSIINLNPNGMIKGKPNGDRYTSGALGICTYKPKKYTPFIGKMDEFRIYGRALTQEEIDSLFINPTNPIDIITVTNYPLDIQVACNGSIDTSYTGSLIANSPCYNSTTTEYSDVTDINGNITRTWLTTDECGNYQEYVQLITIETDITSPIPDANVIGNITSDCEVTSLSAPTATDNCAGIVSATTNATLPITNQGTTVVTWNYDDGNGNVSTQTQNVIINDNIAPVANNSSLIEITAECEVTMLSIPTATDNCAGIVSATTNATLPITNQGTTLVTWNYDDGNGNVSTQTQEVNIIGIDNDITLLNDDVTLSIYSPTASSYQWISCLDYTLIANATQSIFTPIFNGEYAVIVSNGICSDTSDCLEISIIGLKETHFSNNLIVYPNPTQGDITIDLGKQYPDVTLTILNSLGQIVVQEDRYAVQHINVKFEGAPGVYFLKVNTKNKIARVVLINE